MNNPYSVRYTDLFFSDLESAPDYISNELSNPAAARSLYSKVKKETASIAKMPFSFPDCSYWYLPEAKYRHAPIGNYSVFFEVNEKERTVIFLRFMYSAMNITDSAITQ